MANITGKRTRSQDHVVEEFVPSAAWTEDSHSHYLLVDLPDFRKEEVKLQVDTRSGQITVSGERLANNNKYIYFEKKFKAPENSDIDKITGKFDGDILYVNLPKQVQRKESKNERENNNIEGGVKKDSEQEKPSEARERSSEKMNEEEERKKKKESKKGSSVDEFGRETIEKWGADPSSDSVVDKAMGILMKNKSILLTAVLAFSLGILVSRKFDSTRD